MVVAIRNARASQSVLKIFASQSFMAGVDMGFTDLPVNVAPVVVFDVMPSMTLRRDSTPKIPQRAKAFSIILRLVACN